MDKWEEFEIAWTEFLKKTYGDLAYFERMGGSDSTKPDILVKTKKGKEFYIETKMCPAQCGQFVLIPNIKTKTFEYSEKNETPINEFAKEIIRFMNRYYESFKNAGTAGKAIEFDGMEEVFANWVIKIYGDENVEIFATNNWLMVPLKEFPKFFSVTAKYRIKRSGSGPVGNVNMDNVISFIKDHYSVESYRKTTDGALFFKSSKNLHNERFDLGTHEYMFSYRENEFEIRRLSNTFNANVIFSIRLKHDAGNGMSREEFKKYLKK